MFNVVSMVPGIPEGIKVTPEPLPFWEAVQVQFGGRGYGFVYRRKLVPVHV